MRNQTVSSKVTIVLLFTAYCLMLTTSLGCEAFRRKFVRKSKEKEVRVVVETREYESKYSIGEMYKKYFLFWRAAHDELINSLQLQDGSLKKRVYYAEKIIENLQQMRRFILPEKQAGLDKYILEQKRIANQLDKYNLTYSQASRIKSLLEKQKRKIQKEFTYRSIQGFLIEK